LCYYIILTYFLNRHFNLLLKRLLVQSHCYAEYIHLYLQAASLRKSRYLDMNALNLLPNASIAFLNFVYDLSTTNTSKTQSWIL